MAQKDELVLAVRTDELFARGIFQGLKPGGAEYLEFIFDPRNSRYVPRSAAETDPSWKQIIPYVVLSCAGQLLVYRRGRRSTETRLVDLHSVGLGGHINPGDESIFAVAGFPAYQAAMRREVAEEVAMPENNLVSDRIAGVINDDSVEVGRVHFGIVHVWELRQPEVTSRETKIADLRFVEPAELRNPGAPVLETWSQLCLDQWEHLQRQPGWTA
jgi:predicted NUDIX family phosphoesterase